MADDDNVLNIDISADDYAKAAATDRDVETFVSLSSTTAPGTGADAETVAQARAQAAAAKAEKKASRTFQSEEDFQAEKRSYVAKNDAGGVSLSSLSLTSWWFLYCFPSPPPPGFPFIFFFFLFPFSSIHTPIMFSGWS